MDIFLNYNVDMKYYMNKNKIPNRISYKHILRTNFFPCFRYDKKKTS